MTKAKHHNLSIMLIKKKFKSFDQIIKPDVRVKKFNIVDDKIEIGTLYIKPVTPHPPKWSAFFEKVIDINDIGFISSVAAVLLINVNRRIFAITFGQGRYILQSDSWVERFGLKVALNSIGREKLRTIDKQTFDAISRQSKEQASKETDARDFGLDIEQDLLRAVTGVPKDHTIGKRIYGMDSLNVSTDTQIGTIKEFIERIYDKYVDDSYKIDFPWVDHISEIKDKSRIVELENLLFHQIASGNLDKIWMAVPEIIEWNKVGGFCYLMNEKSPEYQDIHLPDFLNSLRNTEIENISRKLFANKQVKCVDSDGYLFYQWQAIKCLYCELDIENHTCLLNGGKWYEIENDFVKTVNNSYSDIPDYEITLPKYNDESEGEYNERVAKAMPDKFALMDRKNIPYGGGQSKIEFCDLLYLTQDIIHIKRYGSSSVLSHLFAQGRISGELFQMESDFRNKVNDLLSTGFKIENPEERPNSDAYQIVFAIISNIPGDLNIPFFSRLNLKNSYRNLRGLGYRVAKAKIEVDSIKKMTKKYRPRRKSR